MEALIQNHPGERHKKPRPKADHDHQGLVYFMILLLVGAPMGIAIAVLTRLRTIGKINGLMMYVVLAVVFLVCMSLVILMVRKFMFKNMTEQKKYYRLAGGLTWLPMENRAALQLEAHYCYHTGSWLETLEYWPAEVRLPSPVRFTTFQLASKEDRLAANDQAWGVLSEKSFTERIDTLFAGMHSQLFAADKRVMGEQNRSSMIARLGELTQLPENYITTCWEHLNDRPARLVWAFDLQRVVELSRTSFMAGLISEQKAWEQILKASDYAHALFDSLDDFFNNYRLGHAYWCNDFRRTNEVAQMQKNFNNECKWAIKEIPWTKKNSDMLPEVIRTACKDYVEAELKKNTRTAIGFNAGNSGA